MVENAIRHAEDWRKHRERNGIGLDGFALCADYCFNVGPFMSPRHFEEFVTPYLARLTKAYRDMGYYVIKHTDGNIMPIIDHWRTWEVVPIRGSLSAITRSVAFAISGTHWVGDVVARVRRQGAERVAVASYLLADGLFQDRLYTCGADVVTDPLGRHPGVAKLVAHRFRTARLSLAA